MNKTANEARNAAARFVVPVKVGRSCGASIHQVSALTAKYLTRYQGESPQGWKATVARAPRTGEAAAVGQDDVVSSAAFDLLVGSGLSSSPEVQELSRILRRLSGITGRPDDRTPLADLRDVRARLFGYGRVEQPLI